MLASKLVLVCLFLEFALVGSVYEPVRLDDIKKLVFRKYEKTDGTYRRNQLNCTNYHHEICELHEPSSIICFHSSENWDCYIPQSIGMLVGHTEVSCEQYPFLPERVQKGYVVRDSCYLNYELRDAKTIFSSINGILVFYLISIMLSLTFISLAYKNRGNLKYSRLDDHQYFRLKNEE